MDLMGLLFAPSALPGTSAAGQPGAAMPWGELELIPEHEPELTAAEDDEDSVVVLPGAQDPELPQEQSGPGVSHEEPAQPEMLYVYPELLGLPSQGETAAAKPLPSASGEAAALNAAAGNKGPIPQGENAVQGSSAEAPGLKTEQNNTEQGPEFKLPTMAQNGQKQPNAGENKMQSGEQQQQTATAFSTNQATAPHALGMTEAAVKTQAAEPLFQLRPAEGSLAPQLTRAIVDQVGQDAHGQTSLRLRLYPAELGEVLIRIIYRDGNLTTHFQAASEQAKQLIEGSLSQLRETLSGMQLNLQQASVSVGSQGKGQEHFQQHEPRFQGLSENGAADAGSVLEFTDSATAGRLNYFV